MKIIRGASNTLYFTLEEKKTLSTAYYLFVFENDITGSSKIFRMTDISSYPYRYNKFTLTETSSTNDLTTGVVTLSPAGYWTYKIYEQSDPNNLLVSNTTSLVEQGRIDVVGDDVVTFTKYFTDRTFNVYE